MDRLITLPLQQVSELLVEGLAALRRSSRYPEVPALEPRLGLLGHALLDRTFTLMTTLATGVPLPHLVRRMVEEAQSAHGFYRERGWLENPLPYHRRPPRLREVESKRGSVWVRPGFSPTRYEHISFASRFEPHEGEPGGERWQSHPTNSVAHAYVLRHAEPRPWLVCVHGFAMGTPLVNFVGFPARFLHEKLGLNLIFPVLPLHGPRGVARMSGGEVLSPDYLRMVLLFSQAVWDVRRVLSWVRAQGGEQVGLYGLSLGGYVSALVAALEDDLECVVAGIPAVDFAGLARDNEPWIMRRYDREFALDWQLVRAITHVVSPLAVTPRVPRERRFIYAGVADRIARPDQARALWRHWERPAIHWFQGGHVLGLGDRGIAAFLAKSLGASGMLPSARAARAPKKRRARG
jgi:pimeloyl-ACP methyl ester carboxylesterase